MESASRFGALCVGKKGYDFLVGLCERERLPVFICSYSQSKDRSQSFERIRGFADKVGARFEETKSPRLEQTDFPIFVVGWQYMIPELGQNLIVFHDSLLPRYRGFAPTMTALMNGDTELGITAFVPVEEVDAGPILAQACTPIRHPMRLAEAFEIQSALMTDVAVNILNRSIGRNNLVQQDATKATYSLWRDELDLFIDWHADAETVQRQVYACGFPYGGARGIYDGSIIIIDDVELAPDARFERRDVGKIGSIDGGKPVVVCGSGCVRITKATDESGTIVAFDTLRSRFITRDANWLPRLRCSSS